MKINLNFKTNLFILEIVFLLAVILIALPVNAEWTPGTILVAHKTTSGNHVITQLDSNGNVLRQFGNQPTDEFRSHLAISGGILYRVNGAYIHTIDQFSDDGSLVLTVPAIPPGGGVGGSGVIMQIAPDFIDSSIYTAGPFAPTNVVYYLDDPSTGAMSQFVLLLDETNNNDIRDLYLGGPIGGKALFALMGNPPWIPSARVAKIAADGSYQFFDSPELDIETWIVDIGSVAVDSVNGNVYVATGTKIVMFDAVGNPLGSIPFTTFKPSLDVDKSGNLYVGLWETGNISVLSPVGMPIKSISIPNATQIVDVLIVPEPTNLSELSPVKVWIGLKNSDDVGIRFDLFAEVYKGPTLVGTGRVDSVAGGSSGFNNAKLDTIPLSLFAPVDLPVGTTLSIKLYVRNACAASGKNSGSARLWFNDTTANSQFGLTFGVPSNYYLRDGFQLAATPGSGPKKTIDIVAGSKCSVFKSFGTWSLTP